MWIICGELTCFQTLQVCSEKGSGQHKDNICYVEIICFEIRTNVCNDWGTYCLSKREQLSCTLNWLWYNSCCKFWWRSSYSSPRFTIFFPGRVAEVCDHSMLQHSRHWNNVLYGCTALSGFVVIPLHRERRAVPSGRHVRYLRRG